jgi:Family of unknown function (DUF6953)
MNRKYTPRDAAEWMFEQLEKRGDLAQDDAAYGIERNFGKEFVYENENGNLAISRAVLAEFTKLTEGLVVWNRSDKEWRTLSANEKYDGRQEDE